jgi:hypothetical protein
MINILNVLSKEECKSVSDRLKEIPHDKFKDHKLLKILGTNLYECENFNQYILESQKTNIVLERFKDVYDKVAVAISKSLNVTVEYNKSFSLPGFQLYYFDETLHKKSPARIWHYDDEKLGFPVRPVDYDITITMLIENPGLSTYQYFPQTHSLYTREKPSVCKEHVHLKSWQKCTNPNCELTDDKIETICYEEGVMVLTRDRYLHRIGPTEFHDETKQRITLQGHGYFKNNKLYLHW